ncbi:MAG: hypothetical protein DRQ02_12725 [Candidatus Latescibacterota bacterium]|nr:MAG: hypothetical protein DRQ02_12725 [Candidatus Latescibacterota bacterium]RLI50772.1 MAG: hypothetical protein DRO73_02085 [Candidatus Thorarchaeota archaeon]
MERNMIFRCRNCGETSSDIDMVLDGACKCGSTRFELVSEDPVATPADISPRERLRRDLHLWVDLNIDSLDLDAINNLRVRFEFDNDHGNPMAP